MALSDVLTQKQAQAFRSYIADDWRTMILSGAVRAGKTYIDNLIFADELRRVRNLSRKKPPAIYSSGLQFQHDL